VYEAIKYFRHMVEGSHFIILRITFISLMLSSNGEINARRDNSVTWSLLDNYLRTSGMSPGKTMLWLAPYRERTPPRRLLITIFCEFQGSGCGAARSEKWFRASVRMSAHSRDGRQYLLRHVHSTNAAIYNHAFQTAFTALDIPVPTPP